jgi:hypothetical protein
MKCCLYVRCRGKVKLVDPTMAATKRTMSKKLYRGAAFESTVYMDSEEDVPDSVT